MKLATLIFVFLMMAFPVASFAASSTDRLKVENEENGPISNKIINDVYENCLFHIPKRFTPDAREYYCACNSAALQGNFLMSEYRDLQRQSNRKPGNKTFEKYIKTAVAPCVDMPVQQIEYLSCVLGSSSDLRVGNVPVYCNCVSEKMSRHAKLNAETEIMTRMTQYPEGFKDPVDALWDNRLYISTKLQSRDQCLATRNPR